MYMYIRRPLDCDKAKDRHLIELVKLTTKGADKLTSKEGVAGEKKTFYKIATVTFRIVNIPINAHLSSSSSSLQKPQ